MGAPGSSGRPWPSRQSARRSCNRGFVFAMLPDFGLSAAFGTPAMSNTSDAPPRGGQGGTTDGRLNRVVFCEGRYEREGVQPYLMLRHRISDCLPEVGPGYIRAGGGTIFREHTRVISRERPSRFAGQWAC
jgi:hypothetical protein